MKTLLAVILSALVAHGGARESAAAANSKRRAKAVAISHAFYTDTVPVFEVNDATIREALALLRSEWTKKHPRDPFPVRELQPEEPVDGAPRTGLTISVKEVPYIEILKYITGLANLGFREQNGVILVKPIGAGVCSWRQVFDISPGVLGALNLNPKSSNNEIKEAIRRSGIEFTTARMGLSESGNSLIVETADEQLLEQISALLHLVGKGFKIQK